MEDLLTDNVDNTSLEFHNNTENDRGVKHTFGPNNVIIIDDLFDHHFISEVEHWFMTDQAWKLDNTASRYSQPYGLDGFHKFLSITHFMMPDMFNPDWPGFDPILEQVYSATTEHLGIQDAFLNSIQSNAMPYKCDGTFHVDVGGTYHKLFDRIVAVDQMYTLMYFSNSRWDSDWGGQFEYIDRSGNSHKIDYVPGRIILFPAFINA